jgi:thiol:disulfide interchange protein DsbD
MRPSYSLIAGAVVPALSGLFATPAAEPWSSGPVDAELISEVAAIRPATPFRVGVRLTMRDGWHVNWVNPGDAGLAPVIEWSLPDGYRVGDIEWPFPERYELPGVCIYGYDEEVVLLCRITPPVAPAPEGEVRIGAAVSWLACRESCVPGKADLAMSLPLADSRDDRFERRWIGAIDSALVEVPTTSESWRFAAKAEDDRIVLEASQPGRAAPSPENVTFFPFRQGLMENCTPQTWSRTGTGFRLELRRDKMGFALPDTLAGVLVSGAVWEGGRRALTVNAPLR